MTKKHFVAVAKVLRGVREDYPTDAEAVDEVARRLAVMFKDANPEFDRSRFLAAISPAEG